MLFFCSLALLQSDSNFAIFPNLYLKLIPPHMALQKYYMYLSSINNANHCPRKADQCTNKVRRELMHKQRSASTWSNMDTGTYSYGGGGGGGGGGGEVPRGKLKHYV